ncbi:hypothetical protein [Salmonella phage SD-1_S14]|nr:hypothetical protein [Salmonella phage SD-1_S14]
MGEISITTVSSSNVNMIQNSEDYQLVWKEMVELRNPS